MNPIIQVEQLSKVFAASTKRRARWRKAAAVRRQADDTGCNHANTPEVKVALHPTDFTVDAGETIAFIGPNGAGKSTTIKMLTGILHPTAGDARVLGLRPWERRIELSYHIGTVFGQKSQLWYHLPPRDTFILMGKIYNIPGDEFRRRRDELVDRFQLGPLMDVPVRKLSLGERMRSEMALSFLHKPRILFLDEPTIGLDVVVKQSIRELIRALNREDGVTVFLTSHDATDIESLCGRVLVINQGSLLFDGPTPQLVNRFLHYKEIRLRASGGALAYRRPGVEMGVADDGRVSLVVDVSLVRIDEVLADVIRQCDVQDISVLEPSMEEIIRAIYTEPKVYV